MGGEEEPPWKTPPAPPLLFSPLFLENKKTNTGSKEQGRERKKSAAPFPSAPSPLSPLFPLAAAPIFTPRTGGGRAQGGKKRKGKKENEKGEGKATLPPFEKSPCRLLYFVIRFFGVVLVVLFCCCCCFGCCLAVCLRLTVLLIVVIGGSLSLSFSVLNPCDQ